MKQECVMTIDLGTSSYRVSLFNRDFTLKAHRSKKITGSQTLDAQRCWEEICNMTRHIMEDSDRDVKICGISVSSQVAWVAIDREGRPVAPAMTWMDQSPEEAEELSASMSEELIYQKTARRVSAEYGGLKLRKIAKRHPEAYGHINTFFSLKDFINYKLTGIAAIDRTSACYTLLYNPILDNWDDKILKALSISEKLLPQLFHGSDILGNTIISEMPVPAGIPVAVSGPDGTVGVLGAGGFQPGTAVDIMGTTDVFFTCSKQFVYDGNHRLIVNPHVVEGLWVVGGPMGLSGGAAGWVVHSLMGDRITYEELNEQVENIPPGCDGLLMNPGLCGERAPFWNPDIAGSVFGIRLEHTAAHFFRAIMEGNSYAVRYLCRFCEEAGSAIDRIIAIGGATKQRGWLKIKADITGIPVYHPEVVEATSIGCAALAWMAAGSTLTELRPLLEQPCEVFIPDATTRPIYERVYRRYLMFMKTAADFYQNQKGGDLECQDL